MARNFSTTTRIDRLARKGAHQPWAPLLLVSMAVMLLLSSAKAMSVLLPYINNKLF